VPKILSRAGTSLADTWDVEGSIAGVDELVSREVSLVDEMGARVFSERALTFVYVISSTAIAQSTVFDVVSPTEIPDSPNRLMAVTVLVDAQPRMSFASLAVQDAVTGREIPVWVWDSSNDLVKSVRWSNDGAGVVTAYELTVEDPQRIPYLLTRQGDNRLMPGLIWRGQSSGFGAGTVTARCLVSLCRANRLSPTPGEPSSHGLPIPGW